MTPLRLLLNLLFNPEVYYDLLQIHRLEHHSEQRRKCDPKIWQFHQKFVVDRIKALRPQIVTTLESSIKADQKKAERIKIAKRIKAEQEMVFDNLDSVIHECVCRLRTNTLQLNTENSKLRSAMGLYPIYSFLNHSCMANTTTTKFTSRQGFRYIFCRVLF